MVKKKMILFNLIRNSVSAYFAAIEIHNKPNVDYRYETTTLLLHNAWELALKAYVRKFLRSKTIFETDKHTISFDKALDIVDQDLNIKLSKSFLAVRENLILLETYRNQITHFYCEAIEPYIFMIIAKAALNYVDFMKTYFMKDVALDESLYILPLGFKLPFRPEDFLSKKSANYKNSAEARQLIEHIIRVITHLKENDIEESVVLGFDVYLESIKKMSNSDLLVAITTEDEADVLFSKVNKVRITSDKSAQKISISDEEFRRVWKYSYKGVVDWCRANIDGYKKGKQFNAIMKEIKKMPELAYRKKLDSDNDSSPSQEFYSEKALLRIKNEYHNS